MDPHGAWAAWVARSPLAATMGGVLDDRDRMPPIAHRHAAPAPATWIARQRPIDEAIAQLQAAAWTKKPVSIGLLGNAADILPELYKRRARPDLVTDQTSAHDLVHGYLPSGWSIERWEAEQKTNPKAVESRRARVDRAHVRSMLDFHRAGVPVVDYGNNIRQVAKDEGSRMRSTFPAFVPAYVRPLFCEGKGPFRWVALSGDPEDIYRTDAG
jgi:urocanate hydratase